MEFYRKFSFKFLCYCAATAVRNCLVSRFDEPDMRHLRASEARRIETYVERGSKVNAVEMAIKVRDTRRFLKISLCTTLLLLSSCYSNSPSSSTNEIFEQKYGKEIEKIKAERTPDKRFKNEITISQPTIQSDLSSVKNYDDSNQGYYAYVDVSQFGEKEDRILPREYFPNAETYQQAKNNYGNQKSDIFDISYDTKLYPPFRRAGIEFDRIRIPELDAYGTKTQMSEKPYLLAGNNVMQKTIDQVTSEKSPEDIEISKILIEEQKQLKRKQKMIQVFGHEFVEELPAEKSKEKAVVKNNSMQANPAILAKADEQVMMQKNKGAPNSKMSPGGGS